jgi:hypothetical protein
VRVLFDATAILHGAVCSKEGGITAAIRHVPIVSPTGRKMPIRVVLDTAAFQLKCVLIIRLEANHRKTYASLQIIPCDLKTVLVATLRRVRSIDSRVEAVFDAFSREVVVQEAHNAGRRLNDDQKEQKAEILEMRFVMG